jgi:hypothetical protein
VDASEHSPSLRALNGAGGSMQLQSDYRRRGMASAEGSMASLADGTGGTFFHNRNDLGNGLAALTAAMECMYLLEFSPSDVKPDGTYHRLKVKAARNGLQIEARHGYFVPRPDKRRNRRTKILRPRSKLFHLKGAEKRRAGLVSTAHRGPQPRSSQLQ